MAQRSLTSRRGDSWALLGGLLSVVLASSTSHAAPDAFSQHFQAAKVCYDEKKYDCVITELRAAYKIQPQPALLLNIGHAFLDSGRPALALEHYDWYLFEEKQLSAEVRADVDRYREQARQQLEAQRGPTPPPQPTAPPQPAVVPAPTATVEKPVGRKSPPVAPIVLMSSGVALVIVGAALGGAALSASKEVVSGNGPFDQALDDRGRLMDKAGIAFDAIGATLFVAGAAWGIGWAVTAKKSNTAPVVYLKPAPGGAFVVGRF